MGFFLKKIRLLFVNSIMKIYIGAEVEFVEFCDLHAWERERKRANIYFYRLLFQIIHSFKHFIIIVLNRRYVGKCKYFYSNLFFFLVLLRQTCDNATEFDRFFIFYFFCYVLQCSAKVERGNIWLFQPSVTLYISFLWYRMCLMLPFIYI